MKCHQYHRSETSFNVCFNEIENLGAKKKCAAESAFNNLRVAQRKKFAKTATLDAYM
jgi:hypothetical protein